MKEDVLEQVVEDFLQNQGYFTRHNLKFRPDPLHADFISKQDSVPSDIDVIGIHPTFSGAEKVIVVSCKSWQSGFNPEGKLKELNKPASGTGKDFWKHFREIWSPKWVEAFQKEVLATTGQSEFTYCIAVSHLTGKLTAEEASILWMDDPTIARNLAGCSLKFITMEEMWHSIVSTVSTTPASSEIGRLAQLMKAAGIS
uniref:NERD domain-containing protein n=1 Tax=uncultured Actinomycetes bacterium TaxID=152507 RepID=A0A871YCD1_9ACTN|nr:hypothetical protein HULAa32G3_00034 [uncultured Actinomycetes bacterium]